MIINILVFFLLILGAFLVDIQTMLFMFFFYIFGIAIVSIFNKKEKVILVRIYMMLFCAGASYMLASYAYMTYHDYSYLFSFDAIDSFIPDIENYLSAGGYFSVVSSILKDYSFFDRNIVGYNIYAAAFGYIGNLFEVNFYVGQQISVLFLYSFVGVVLYKLFRVNRFNKKKSFQYVLIISFSSIIFFFSSLITRDIHILLLYLLAIYFTFKKSFSIVNLLKLILVIIICITFRVESGLFLVVLIPTYLLLSLQQSRQKTIVLISSTIIGIIFLSVVISNYNTVKFIFDKNQEIYVEDISEGSGVISILQKIPVAGDFASIIYNAAQPLPFWAHFNPPKGSNRVEMYNIMNFPKSVASFFNWLVIVYILYWLFSKNQRSKTKNLISKPLKYQLWIGLVFLFMQSAVIAQRRLMAYYCVYYILFFIIYSSISTKDKKIITFIAISSFIFLQITSVIYLS